MSSPICEKPSRMHIDKPPFDSVYDQYYFSVFRYVKNRLANPQDAEDLTAEVFLYCFSHYDDYDPEKSSLNTWLYLVASSRLKNHYRDRRDWVDMEEVEAFLFAEGQELERAVYLEQLRTALAGALDLLPDRQRKTVVLRYFKEWDYARIADELGTTEGNVRVILSRAIDQIGKKCSELKDFLL